MGDSFWMYLSDTIIIQGAHCKALWAPIQEMLTLLHAQPADIMQNMLMSDGTANANMGEYCNEMDWTISYIYNKMFHWKNHNTCCFYWSIGPAMSRARNTITRPIVTWNILSTSSITFSSPTFSLCSICHIWVHLRCHKSFCRHLSHHLSPTLMVHLKTIHASPQWKTRRLIGPSLISVPALREFFFRIVNKV